MGSSILLPHTGQPGPMKPGDFESSFVDNVVSFAFRRLSPPSAVYIQRDDTLLIGGATTLAGENIIFTGRFLAAPAPRGGQPGTPPLHRLTVEELLDTAAVIMPFAAQVPAVGNLVQNNAQITGAALELGEGYLLSLNANAVTAIQRGQTFARAYLRRTGISLLAASSTLFADYVTKRETSGFPNGPVHHPVEGPGSIQSLNIANPAAGADWTMTVPTALRRRVSSFNAQLAIANAGAARIIRVQIKDAAGNIVWQAPAQQTGAINTTVQVSAAPGQFSSVVDTTTLNLPLPDVCVLEAGFTMGVSTSNINAGDQWSNIWFEDEDWVDAA